MRHLTKPIRAFHFMVLAFLMTLSSPLAAQDFQKGLAAAQADDFANALQEWKPLAKAGNSLAQYNLGKMYHNGEGVPQNNAMAYMWYQISAATGNELGGNHRDSLAKKMTTVAIEQAQAMARECVGSNYKKCPFTTEADLISMVEEALSFDVYKPESLSYEVIREIEVAISPCWDLGSSSSAASSTIVVVEMEMSLEGKPLRSSINLLEYGSGDADSAKWAFETAQKAIMECGAKGFNLPLDQYSVWRFIEMTFHPNI